MEEGRALKRSMLVLGSVATVIVAAVLAYVVLQHKPGEDDARQVLACGDLHQGCSLPGLKVQALQLPSAMHAFTVQVEVADASKVEARFEMRDMAMGLNHYRFLAKSPGLWQASVILPVCIDGRSDWTMLLDVTSGTARLEKYQLAFNAPAEQAGAGQHPHDAHHAH